MSGSDDEGTLRNDWNESNLVLIKYIYMFMYLYFQLSMKTLWINDRLVPSNDNISCKRAGFVLAVSSRAVVCDQKQDVPFKAAKVEMWLDKIRVRSYRGSLK